MQNYNSYLFSSLIILILFICTLFITKRYLKKHRGIILYEYIVFFSSLFRELFIRFEIKQRSNIEGVYYIVLTFSLIKIVDFLINEVFSSNLKKDVIPKLFRTLIIIVLFFSSILLLLKKYYSINLAPILTTSAIISAVVGLALQDTLMNFIAGIVLTSEKSFKKGDTIKIDDIIGKIVETDWRSTKINYFGDGIVTVPNSYLVKQKMTNYYKKIKFRVIIKISTSYSTYPNVVSDILEKVANENTKVLKDPAPEAVVDKFGDYSIDYELRVWVVDDYINRHKVESELYKSVWYVFKRNNIKIPFPVREILKYDKTLDLKVNLDLEDYLLHVDFLNGVDKKIITEIANRIEIKDYGKGEIIFYEGESGESFFILGKGEVEVLIGERVVANLKTGDFFGEMSLLTGMNRNASIRCLKDCELFELGKKDFAKTVQNNHILLEKLSEYIIKREEINSEFKQEIVNENKYLNKRGSQKKSILKNLVKFFEI